MAKASEFEVGDKVRVVEGGWGCSPDDIGKVVTVIEKKWDAYMNGYWAYKVLGDLPATRGRVSGKGEFMGSPSFKLEVEPPVSQETTVAFERIGDLAKLSITGVLSKAKVQAILDVLYN
jgi:hypothetical protein